MRSSQEEERDVRDRMPPLDRRPKRLAGSAAHKGWSDRKRSPKAQAVGESKTKALTQSRNDAKFTQR